MKIAVILGYPAILADGALYWFGSSKYYPDEVAYLPTQVAHRLAVHLGVPLIQTAYMDATRREAMAAWAIRIIDRERKASRNPKRRQILTACRIHCRSEQKRARLP